MPEYSGRKFGASRVRFSLWLAVFSMAAFGCRLLSPGPAASQDPVFSPEAALTQNPPPAEPTEPPPGAQTKTPPGAARSTPGWGTLPEIDPGAAMLPEARADLASLVGIPEYRIELEIAPSLASFSGRMLLSYVNRESIPLDSLYFRLLPNGGKSFGDGSLQVTSAALDSQSLRFEQDRADPTVLQVHLPAALPPGGEARIELAFSGEVPLDFGGGDRPEGYGIFNLTRNVLALSGWYPVLAVYDDSGWNLDPTSAIGDSLFSETALYAVTVCRPEDVVVVATGVTVDEESRDAAACIRFESGPVRDFFIMASPEYERVSSEVDGTVVHSYYLPGHSDAAGRALQISTDSLRIYNDQFGAYPFTELDVVEAPMRNALGVEFPGIVLVAETLYDTTDRPEFTVATAHEVAHQWWYSVIGNDIFEEPWLDEGLTTFSSSLYYEFALSPRAAEGLWDAWEDRYERLKQEGRDDPVAESLAYFEQDPGVRSYSGVVYIKGGLFFREVRREIGDDAFFKALQEYYQENKYQVARGESLLTAFESAAGRQLDDLYQSWLY